MGHFSYTSVRSRVKRFASMIGIKRSRSRLPKDIPADLDEQTTRILNAINEYTMTSPERVHALVNAVRYVVTNDIEGDFVECGVWRGGTSMAAALALREMGDGHRHLYLYDTFDGMSQSTDEDIAFDGQRAN